MEALFANVAIIFNLASTVLGMAPGATLIAGTPFQSVPFRYDRSERGAILQTPRFVIVFEGLSISGGGSGDGMTVAGRHGIVPRFWDGYASGHHGGGEQAILADGSLGPVVRRIHFRHDYDPEAGVAKVEFYGHPLTVHSAGRKLHIKNTDFDLPNERAVILVNAKDEPRLASAEQTAALRKILDKQKFDGSASPPQ